MDYTKYEKARIIGARALQLSMGAPFMVKLDDKQLEELEYNVLRIANIEFEQGRVPITIKKKLPNAA
ncbi:DNA-directed RNA polymerase subunit K [Candidatus Woesearchaeota archaeon]|nr:DNA-directed RNA polymerase subunit K [Candidatus Woesearchaeota archaeon]